MKLKHTVGSLVGAGCVDDDAFEAAAVVVAFVDDAPTLLWLFSDGDKIISNGRKMFSNN